MDHGSICLGLIIGFRCGPKPHETMDFSLEQATMQVGGGGGSIMIKGIIHLKWTDSAPYR